MHKKVIEYSLSELKAEARKRGVSGTTTVRWNIHEARKHFLDQSVAEIEVATPSFDPPRVTVASDDGPSGTTAPAPVVSSVPPAPTSSDPLGGLLAMIKQSIMADIEPRLPSTKDLMGDVEGRVTALLQAAEDDLSARIQEIEKPRRLEIVEPKKHAPVDAGVQHFAFPLLFLAMKAKVPVYLHGPAGSGKTSAAVKAAELLGRECEVQSFNKHTSKSDIMGFYNVGGTLMESPLSRAFKLGKVYVGDEIDNGDANVTGCLNAAVANNSTAFPDKMHVAHEDFVPVVTANSIGQGADRKYVGRNQLDAAFLDRFFFVDWSYDEGLEAALIGVSRSQKVIKPDDGGFVDAHDWLNRVQQVRKAVDAVGARHVVSPRASLYGVRLAAVGLGKRWIEEGCLWKGMDKVTREKVEAAIVA